MTPRPFTIRVFANVSACAQSARRLAPPVRTILILLTVAALMYVGYGFGRLFAEWRQIGEPAPAATTNGFELNPLSTALPLAGQWSFAALDWNIRSSIVGQAEVDARFEALANPSAAQDVHQLLDVSSELLELIAELHLQPVERAGYQLYRFDRSDLKALLVVREVDGRTKAVSFAGAYPQNGQQWQMFELTPRGPSSETDTQAAHLIPLPDGAVRHGARFADDGRLLLELISLETNAEALIAAWRDAGWEVRPSGLGDPGGFSFLCARGNDVIYAWSANPSAALQNLMLVRSPTDEELQAQ